MVFKDDVKEVGVWDLVDATELDDCAYYLYCDSLYSYNSRRSSPRTRIYKGCGSQVLFKNAFIDTYYYKDAHYILRTEKLDKLINKINDI